VRRFGRRSGISGADAPIEVLRKAPEDFCTTLEDESSEKSSLRRKPLKKRQKSRYRTTA
jgi:hypothetical protein